MKWVKRGILIAMAAGILFAIAYGFMPKPVPSEIARASTGDIRVSIDEEGFTRVKDRFALSAPVMGSATRIDLKPGDPVTAGALVATVTPTEPMLLDARALASANANKLAATAAKSQADANYERANVELNQAKSEYEKLEKYSRSRDDPDNPPTEEERYKLVSKSALDTAENAKLAAEQALKSAKFGKEVADAQLALAEAALIMHNEGAEVVPLQITSPVSGLVLRVYRESAGPVQTGEMLIEIGDPGNLEVVVDLLSSDAVRVKQGMKVRMERWGGDESLTGTVRRVEPSGFTKISSLGVEEQRVNVIIDFVGKPENWANLGDRYRVETQVITSERENVVKIPTGALFNTPDGTAVFVVNNDKAELRVVKVGDRNGLEAEILSNLNDGDSVIVHPSDEISDGTPVESR